MTEPLVIQDAICPGYIGKRACNNELNRHALKACNGKALPSVRFKCPVCRNMVTVKLEWRLVPVAQQPEVTAEKG